MIATTTSFGPWYSCARPTTYKPTTLAFVRFRAKSGASTGLVLLVARREQFSANRGLTETAIGPTPRAADMMPRESFAPDRDRTVTHAQAAKEWDAISRLVSEPEPVMGDPDESILF